MSWRSTVEAGSLSGVSRSRRVGVVLLTLLTVALLTLAAPAVAQEESSQEGSSAQQPVTPPVSDESSDDELLDDLEEIAADDDSPSPFEGTSQEDLDLIEDLLEESADALETGFVYDAGDRRDPFRSLLVINEGAPRRTGPRPEGIPGLLIDEIVLRGIWVTPDGPVAQVDAPDTPVSYLIRPGDKLYDGDVVRISYSRETGGEIVYTQVVNDPTAPKPFREVVRRLEP